MLPGATTPQAVVGGDPCSRFTAWVLQVVQKIKASGNHVLLAVLDGDSYKAAKALGRDLSQLLPADIRPRLCHIVQDRSGFGFSVSGPEGKAGSGVLVL